MCGVEAGEDRDKQEIKVDVYGGEERRGEGERGREGEREREREGKEREGRERG